MSKKYWYLVLLVLALVTAYVVYRRKKSGDVVTVDDYALRVQNEIAENEKYNEIRNFADADYVKMADDLYTAMKGAGTREDTVFSIFKSLKSNADCKALVDAFGDRKYNKKELDLYGWIAKELTRKEREKINTNLRNKRITYSFYED